MEVRLLGPVEVAADGGTVVAVHGQKLQLLLAALAVEPGRVVSSERLVDILYGEDPPRQPTNSLQVLVSRLRRSLADAHDGAVIETTDAGYALVAGNGLRTDIQRFRELAARARPRVADDPVDAVADLRSALALVRGEPLAGLPGDGWVRAERVRLSEAHLAVVEDRIDAELATGNHGEVVGELERLTSEHPLRERLWGQLILALYRCGRQADALRAYRQARTGLIEELGIEPGPGLRRLEAAVLAQDPALDPPRVIRPGAAGPGSGDGSSGAGGATATVGAAAHADEPATTAAIVVTPDPPDGEAPATGAPTGGATGRGDAAPRPGDVPRFRAAGRRGNVPRPLTACLGREDELADVLDLVDSHRLVTLVGPGGVGKTRLSIEVAHTLAPAAPDGVWLVDLASARDAAGLLGAVVRTLRLGEGALAGSPAPHTVEEVAATLAERRMVLLVDNCEHVVDDVARLAETLLARCPDLRVLATSRETLGVPGEFLYVVPPLPLGHAIELFLERMSAGGVAPTRSAGHAGLAAVTEICRRLDGLPLAVELAAARARHLRLDEMVARLDQVFDLLVEGPRTAQPRQRTLRAVVDWSYELLEPDEQRVFERLSVFSGGATPAAARDVCGGDGGDDSGDDVDPAAVEAVLGRLADKSLVIVERGVDSTRFTMLQTLLDYAAGRLAARGERDDVARRHARWAHQVTTRASLSRVGAGHVDAVRAVQVEAANLIQAVGWALEHDPLLGLEMTGNLGWHWFTTMQSGLAWTVLTASLDRAGHDAPAPLVARAQSLAGLAGVLSGHHDDGVALSEAAHATERRLDDPLRLGWHGFLRATQHVFAADPDEAGRWLDESRRAFDRAADAHGLSLVDYQQGVIASLLGDLDEAHTRLTRACEVFRRTDNHMILMAGLARLGEVAERDGRFDDSFAAFEELHGLALAAAVPALEALAAAGMAFIALEQGDEATATALGDAAVAASHEGFAPMIGGYALAAWGSVQASFGDREEGLGRIHDAAGLFSRIGYHDGAAECWWRLSRVHAEHGECAAAIRSAEQAVECADRGHDRFVRGTARAQLDAVRRLAG